jgi:glutamyl-tRNA reductase
MIGGDAAAIGFDALEKLKKRRFDIEQMLPCVQGVHEFMILDTCNRFEIAGLVSAHTDLELFLPGFPFLTKGWDAYRRLALIAAGLQSEIFGETRIVAQIKGALATAQKNGWAGSFLQGWIDQTLHISKDIRQAVEPHIPALEIEDLVFQCLEKEEKIHPCIGNKKQAATQLLVGRGKIGQGLIGKLGGAVQISGRDDEELRRHLPDADVVICATGSPDFVIGEAHRPLLKQNVILIDLSLPRNIDPGLPGIIDLSMLRAAASPDIAETLLAQAEEIIESHTPEYERLIRFEQRPE